MLMHIFIATFNIDIGFTIFLAYNFLAHSGSVVE